MHRASTICSPSSLSSEDGSSPSAQPLCFRRARPARAVINPHRTHVDDAGSHTSCGVHDMTGSVYIDRTSEHRVRFSVPGAVENHRTSLGAGGNRLWIQDITDHHFDRQDARSSRRSGPPNEHPNLSATSRTRRSTSRPPMHPDAPTTRTRAPERVDVKALRRRGPYRFFHLSSSIVTRGSTNLIGILVERRIDFLARRDELASAKILCPSSLSTKS